ncbi:MAG: methyltransferase domain-containing protein [Gemmataceae bacterium]|nr:methyltransferase domain-containing protein [Gemmataceae bacterium]
MTATASRQFDQAGAEAFGQKLVGVLNGAGLALMTSVGHRTGLFDAMVRLPPADSHAIARAAGLSERYVREWLGAMVTGGIVEHDPVKGTFRLPPEHAACLTRAARPNNMAVAAQFIAVLGAVEDRVVEAFRHGRGIPYTAYPRFHAVMAEESDQTTIAGLEEHILPLVPGLPERLALGVDVLDIGCGSGYALVRMGMLFPASRFVGYDLSTEGIEAGRAAARRAGLRNVRFEVADVARLADARCFDLVTAFDAVHDQADPAGVLRNVRRALRPGGVFLMQDIRACSHLHGNQDHPMAPYLYTVSCMHCMSVSLAAGGPGLGAVWGKELALEMLAAAGFADVTVHALPHDPLNDYYVCQPTP